MSDDTKTEHPFPASKVRLDKWLWAARFFKTRSLAKQAIEGGKVHYNGARSKVSKEVDIGAKLTIRAGWDEKEVEVIALSEQRRGATEAQLLYTETEASIARRAAEADQRKAFKGLGLTQKERPNKKQRRQIHRFKQIQHD
ncbi:MAG: S4 domain-containing protein [Oceanicoccus sp.]|uniref:RNA-binding S4 domain-containing protein n=1 Tax=Oceanicoccus sp. TaxID=2691044 RepID=UPI0026060A72|nr:S4 domain-containing protein [Oceanicoccus sp.]MDG1772387.1 S4 domain-containing protein [Oceanicoccus sp.]